MEEKLSIYCITNLESPFLEKLNYNLVGVGDKTFSNKYINCTSGKNIQKKKSIILNLHFITGFGKIS